MSCVLASAGVSEPDSPSLIDAPQEELIFQEREAS